MTERDRRDHLRYRDPETTALRLLVQDGDAKLAVTGLMVDESYSGLACVYVGAALEVGREIIWQETDEVATPCRVMRCENLHPRVQLLALQILA